MCWAVSVKGYRFFVDIHLPRGVGGYLREGNTLTTLLYTCSVRLGTAYVFVCEQIGFHYTMVTTCLRVSVRGSFSSLEPVELWVVTLSS